MIKINMKLCWLAAFLLVVSFVDLSAQCNPSLSADWSGSGSAYDSSIGVNGVTFDSPSEPGADDTDFSPNGTFNTMNNNYWANPAVEGLTSLQYVINWDETPDGQPDIDGFIDFTDAAEDDAVTRTVTMTFNTPIENPVLHIDRLGGNYSAENGVLPHFSNSTMWTLTTPGVTITRLSGNPQFMVSATEFFREPNINLGTWPTIGGEADGTDGMNGTAAGTIQFNGVVSTLTFDVTGIGVEGNASDGIEMIFEADLSPIVEFTVDPNPNCGGLDVTTTNTSIVNNDLPITYEWTIDGMVVSNDIAPVITFPSSGTFELTLTISDGVCSSSASETVSVSAEGDPSITVESTSSDCETPSSTTFTADATSDVGIASYSWVVTLPDGSTVTSDEESVTVESGAGELSATVTVVNSFGCEATATATATATDSTAEVAISDMIGCAGDTATQDVVVPDGAVVTFEPADSAALVDGVLTATVGDADVTITYTVTSGDCTSNGTFTVTSLLETFDVVSDVELCAGATTLLLSGLPDGYSIESTPEGSTTLVDGNVVFNGSDTDVTVEHTIVSATGCTYTATTNVVIVEADPITVDGDLEGCIGSAVSAIAFGSAGTSYTWTAAGNISIAGPANGASVTATIDGGDGGTLTVTGTSPEGCVSTAQVAVVASTPADVMIGESMDACVGGMSSVSAMGTDGSTYSWTAMGGVTITGGADAQNVEFTLDSPMGGELFVTVTSPDGCVAMDQIAVSPLETPNVELPDTIFACEGMPVELPDDMNFTYTYSGDCPASIDGNIFTFPLAATGSGITELFFCTLNVEIAAGDCVQSEIINVQITPNPINPANTPVEQCEGESVTLNDGALAGYTYSWSAMPGYLFTDTSAGTQVVSVTENTTFTVTATSNDGSGCVFIEDIMVTYNALPVVIDGPTQIDLCEGETFAGDLVVDQPSEVWCYYTYTGSGMQETTVFTGSGSTMTGSGAGSFVYPWMFTDTGSGSGFVTKEIRSLNGGCTSSYIIPVNILGSDVFINADVDNPTGISEIFYCPGDEVVLDASSTFGIMSVVWTDANGNEVSTDDPYVFAPTMDGTYTVVAQLDNGCSATAEVSLISSAASINLASSTGDSYCPGEEVTLTADVVPAGAIVTWVCTDGTTSMENPLVFNPEGTVTCTATVMNGECEAESSITLTPFEGEAVITPSQSTICPGESVEMCIETVDPDCTYLWSTGETTECITVSPDASTEYSVTCTTSDGCQATGSATVTVTDAPSIAADASPSEIEIGETSTLSVTNPDDNCTYTWFDAAGNQIGTGVTVDVTGTEEGTFEYTVICTTADGCTSEATVTVTVVDTVEEPCECSDDDIYIPNTFSPNADNSNDLYNLYTPTGETITYEVLIVDRLGECMYRYDGTDFNAAWDGTYEGDLVNPDVYGYCVRWTCPCDPDVEYVKTGNITLVR